MGEVFLFPGQKVTRNLLSNLGVTHVAKGLYSQPVNLDRSKYVLGIVFMRTCTVISQYVNNNIQIQPLIT